MYPFRLGLAIVLIFGAIQVVQQRIFGQIGGDAFIILFGLAAYFLAAGLNLLTAALFLTDKAYGVYLAILAVLLTTWPAKISYLNLEAWGIFFPYQLYIENLVCLILLYLFRPKNN